MQLTDYLNKNELFSESQSGYRKFHSCETALAIVHNDLQKYYAMTARKQFIIKVVLVMGANSWDAIKHRSAIVAFLSN